MLRIRDFRGIYRSIIYLSDRWTDRYVWKGNAERIIHQLEDTLATGMLHSFVNSLIILLFRNICLPPMLFHRFLFPRTRARTHDALQKYAISDSRFLFPVYEKTGDKESVLMTARGNKIYFDKVARIFFFTISNKYDPPFYK